MTRRFVLAGAVLGIVSLLHAYTQGVDVPGEPPLRRVNADDLVFLVDTSAKAGQANSAGETLITADSDPIAAIDSAAARWNDIADSRVRFSRFDQTPASTGRDSQNVITFRDEAATRSVVGDATAVTSYFVVLSSNTIVESDIIFNPNLRDDANQLTPFATTGQANAFDIEATLAHELGHVIGAKHSSVAGSTMWQNGRRGERFAGTLTPDDQMFAVQAYPENGALGRYGRIQGVAKFESGSPIRGGFATAVDPNGTVVSAFTDLATGAYEILAPPGEYLIFLDPANDPLGPVGLAIDDVLLDNEFATSFFGGNASPTPVAVIAGGIATVDLVAPGGAPPLEIRHVGIREGAFVLIGTGPREIPVDQNTELFLWGPGLDAVQEADVRILGPRVALVPGSVRVSPALVFQGLPALRLTVRPVAGLASTQSVDGGSLGTILITRQGMAAVYTGGIVLEGMLAPPPLPAFTSASVANAASFSGGPIAPGQIISIFGLDLGPAAGVAAPGLNDQGFLPTSLSDVQVTFDGAPAPLFFVSATQINTQAPYEVVGRAATTAVVSYQGRKSPDVSLPVAASAPGVFFLGANTPAIVNQDGSPNTPNSPEARGRAVVVFATGQGAVSPEIPTGRAALAAPLSAVDLADVAATIGGRPATPLFAGLTPSFVGLLQVNLLVPTDAPSGSRVPLSIAIRGRSIQNGVTVSIAP